MIGSQASLASSRELPDSRPRVTLTPEGLRVAWYAAVPQIHMDSQGMTQVSVPGYELMDIPGVPQLPVSSVLVALPPDSNPILEVLAVSDSEQNLLAPLATGQQPAGVIRDSSGHVMGGEFTTAIGKPSKVDQVATIEPIGVVRGVHLARLSFYPVIQKGVTLRVTSSIEVAVNFGAVLQTSIATGFEPDPIRDLVRAAVVNPGQMQTSEVDQLSTSRQPDLNLASTTTLAVDVSRRTITDISYAGLAADGYITSPINLDQVSLSRAGSTIAYTVLGDGDNLFEPGEKIRFFADPRFSRWSTTDTYLLDLDGPSGIPMDSRDEVPGIPTGTSWAELTFEDNEIYTPGCYCAPIPAGRDGDRWVGYQLQRPGDSSLEIPFELPGFDRTKNAFLKIWLIGITDISANPDHKVNVAIKANGTKIDLGTIIFNGKSSHEADFTIPNSLPAGDYRLLLSIPGDTPGIPVDGVWLDAFSVRYALDSSLGVGESFAFNAPDPGLTYSVRLASETGLLAFDISDPEQPKIVTNLDTSGSLLSLANDDQPHDYWVTTSTAIQTPDAVRQLNPLTALTGFPGAEYVIIAPAEFFPSLDPLVAMHQSNGLGVLVEDVQAIYDAFGGGRPLPSAIRDYLEDAYFNWDTAPLYVLLVGDGTHDPKNYQVTSSATYIPPFLEDVDPWAGETAADNRYVTVDGNDTLPDMLIGRLPANNLTELDIMVSKIVNYAVKLKPKFWQHQAVFVADDHDFGGGNFPLLSDTLISGVDSTSFGPQRLYYSPDDSPGEFRSLVNQVWDNGNSLITFTGHSSIHQWAHEILFHLEDVPNLKNGPRLPVVLEMTCFTGSFQIHDYPTLDESLVREPGGGAVAVWGATGLGIATGHHWLAEGFLEAIYEDGIGEIGAAAMAGKLNLASVGSNPDLIDTFTLLGDPATKYERSYQMYAPLTNH